MPFRKSDASTETTTSLPALDVAPEIALGDPDPAQRRRAARLLANTEGGSVPLVAALARESDLSVRDVIVGCLVRRADDTAIDGLAAALRSADAGLRNAAAEALAQVHERSLPLLTSLLQDADPAVRVMAVNTLAASDADVARHLHEVLARDPDENVCTAALDALCSMGTPVSLTAVAAVSARFAHSPSLQFAAEIVRTRIVDAARVP